MVFPASKPPLPTIKATQIALIVPLLQSKKRYYCKAILEVLGGNYANRNC